MYVGHFKLTFAKRVLNKGNSRKTIFWPANVTHSSHLLVKLYNNDLSKGLHIISSLDDIF